MAHYYKQNGKWSFRAYLGIDPETGKYQRISQHGFDTRTEAKAAARELETAVANNTYAKPNHIIFVDFVKEFLTLYGMNVKVSSVDVRRKQFQVMLPYFGQLEVRNITPRAYQQMLAGLQASGYNASTIGGIHTAARMLFKKAREFRIIHADPTEFAKPPRRQSRSITAPKTIPRYLEKDELLHFLDTAKNEGLPGDHALFTLLAYTGVRIGEALALTWQDIDFDAATINISKTLYNPNNNAKQYKLLPPKTATSYRVLPVSSEVLSVLKQWKRYWNVERMRHLKEWCRDYDFVFVAVKNFGYPTTERSQMLRIDRILRLAKMTMHLTPHMFRHTHASLLAAAGVPLHEIMDRLGHADDDTTKRIYLHVTENRKKDAADKFSQYMNMI